MLSVWISQCRGCKDTVCAFWPSVFSGPGRCGKAYRTGGLTLLLVCAFLFTTYFSRFLITLAGKGWFPVLDSLLLAVTPATSIFLVLTKLTARRSPKTPQLCPQLATGRNAGGSNVIAVLEKQPLAM